MEDFDMKNLFLGLICLVSLNANALIVNDSRADIFSLLKTFDLLNIPIIIPSQIDKDLAYNNDNNKTY